MTILKSSVIRNCFTFCIYLQFQVQTLFLITPLVAMYGSNACKELSSWKIKQKLGYNPSESDMSFNMIPPFYKRTKLKNSANKHKLKEKNTRLFGNSTCPSTLNTSEFHMMFRSSCPWFIELSVDKTRIPVTMAKARCRCSNCNMNVLPRQPYPPHPDFSCDTVKTYRRVLREIPNGCDRNGFKNYKVDIEEIPVACTCVAAREAGK